jgi:hypothetical protein
MKATLLLGILIAAAAPAAAQPIESFLSDQHSDGTLWFQSTAPTKSAGSVLLGQLDTGEPPSGMGLQGVWLEWTEQNVFAALLGGGFVSVEVTAPPSGAPIGGALGVAALRGGFVMVVDGGELVAVTPRLGGFLWTADKLYLVGFNPALVVAEVMTPTGSSLAGVKGVALLTTQGFDLDPTLETEDVHVYGSALVYTGSAVFHVEADLSAAGNAFKTAEVTKPPAAGGGPIAGAAGVAVSAGALDLGTSPPSTLGAAFVWTSAEVFFVLDTVALTVASVPVVPAGEQPAIWGVMPVSGSIAPLRVAALVWRRTRAHLVTFLPGLTILEATDPDGAAIASGVSLPVTPSIQRQAGALYEVSGRYKPVGSPVALPGQIVGTHQRIP